jgi:Tol biopolymer transport system component
MKRLARPAAASLAAVLGLGTVSLTAVPAHATFHGRNGRIAFTLDKGSGAQIYTINPDGTGRRQLTHVDGAAVDPDWSPDGRHIVFEVDHPNETGCSVEIMDADGSNIRDLTGNRKGCEMTPAFTPDGRRIVFAHDCDQCAVVLRSMNLQGKDRLILRAPRLYKKEPQVSPDGRTVLFLVEKELGVINGVDENVKALYSVRMNGTHLKIVVPFDFDVGADGGDWAPDGKRIDFSDNAGAAGEPQTKPTNLATIRPDGTGLRFLTHFQGIGVSVGSGSYSPDGRWILFKTQRGDNYALWKIHPDGTGQTLIARFKFSPGTRDWGHNRRSGQARKTESQGASQNAGPTTAPGRTRP